MKSKLELEQCADRLLRCNKPKVIAASFNSKSDLTEEQERHFDTAEYLFQTIPNKIDGPHEGMFMGLLLDEELDYVHIVFVSKEFLDYIASKSII